MRHTRWLLPALAILWFGALLAGAVVAVAAQTALVPPILAVPGYGTVGVILAVKRPRMVFGWLLLALASVPLLTVFVSLSPELQNGIPLAAMAVILVLFPTGRPPSRRWLAPVVLAVASWFGAGRLGLISVGNGFELETAVIVALLALTICALAPIVRYRRAEGVERAQLQWLGVALAVTVLGAGMGVIGAVTRFGLLAGTGGLVGSLAFTFGIPGAFLVAMLRHGLYDIDRILGRTFAYAIVAAVLTVGYLGVVVGIGAVVGRWGPGSDDLGVAVPLVATALVSIAFQPVRMRALRRADRLVYGRRRTPYEALTGLTGRSLDELVRQIAELSVESTAARRAVVWLADELELRPVGVYPAAGTFPAVVAIDAGDIPATLGGGPAVPIRLHGDSIGAISVEGDPGEGVGADDLRLLTDLAAHAATAVRALQEATPLPTGVVTFLMTDIEGSTRLWEDGAESMAAAIRRHDALVGRVVADHSGVLIKWRGEGDSTFSVFADPVAAVAAAAGLQEAMRAEAWPTDRPISVRAALHTGEAELRGRDYFGRTVNRCARLRALAVGGQTLFSAATRELVRDRLAVTLTVRDLGERTLRDIAEPEHVFELIIAPDGAGAISPVVA